MANLTVNFKITSLKAEVAESIALEWQGKEIETGPITVELDEALSQTANLGTLDYDRRHACAEFHIRLLFPELASTLESLGVDERLTHPLRAIVRSEGEILADHSFVLSGGCDLSPHVLFPAVETRASVLPGV
jgi:hypothetical protein